MFLKKSFTLTFILVIINIIRTASTVENTLQVHVVFRHGDRTPDKVSLYPTDPHINDTWFPYGLGALTNLGKKEMYELGRSLRKRYDNFLGDLYLPGIQEAVSTSYSRTKISLQLVLAGLWPPNKQQTFANDLPWQPIDYKYKSKKKDELLGYPLLQKSQYLQEFNKVEKSSEVQNFLKQNKDKINYINSNSGLRIKHSLQLMVLYFGFHTEERTNRTLPSWTKSIYPEFLENAVKYSYQWQTATNDMIKFAGGPFIKKVLLDVKDKIKRKTSHGGRAKKIFLYSGHEYNIAHILRALKSFKLHIPLYASHITFELHKVGPTYGLIIYYQDTKQEEPELIQIPGCQQFCPIDQFEHLMSYVIPDSLSTEQKLSNKVDVNPN